MFLAYRIKGKRSKNIAAYESNHDVYAIFHVSARLTAGWDTKNVQLI